MIVDPRKGSLIGAFLSITLAVVVSRSNPATAYELSVYEGTPLLAWALLIAPIFVAIVVSRSEDPTVRSLSMLAGGLATFVIVAIRLIRGYFYVNEGDALTHLGRARDIGSGALPMHELRYPAVHSIASSISKLTVTDLHYTIALLVVVFSILYLVFVPLAVRALGVCYETVRIAVFTAVLYLPVNHIGFHLNMFPTTQAVFFAPLIVFFLFRMTRTSRTGFFIAFMISSTSLILLHPQQGSNFALFFLAILTVWAFQRYLPIPNVRLNPFAFLIFFILLWIWIQELPTFEVSFEAFVETLVYETEAADDVIDRASGLSAAGGSFIDAFLRLFLVPMFVILFSAYVFSATVAKLLPVEHRTLGIKRLVTTRQATTLFYLFVGMVPVVGMFVAYTLGGYNDQYFRHFGLLMTMCSIIAPLAIAKKFDFTVAVGVSGRDVLITVLILATIPVLYPSPFVFDTSNHVTEAQYSGHELAFEYEVEDVKFSFVRSRTARYGDAIQGVTAHSWDYYYGDSGGQAPDHFGNHTFISTHKRHYLVITEADRQRDPDLWGGFRFDDSDFRYIENNNRTHRVISNGGFDMYYIQ